MTPGVRLRWWKIPLGACLGAILGCAVAAVVLWWWPGIYEPRHQEGVWVCRESSPPNIDLDRGLALDRFRAERVAERLTLAHWPGMSRADLVERTMESAQIRLIEGGKSSEFRFKGETREQVQDLYREVMRLYRGWNLWVAEDKLAEEDRGLHGRLGEANHQVMLAERQLREFARQAETDPIKARILGYLRERQEPPANDPALREEVSKLAEIDRTLSQAVATRDELMARLESLDLPQPTISLPTGMARLSDRQSNAWLVMGVGAGVGLVAGGLLGWVEALRRSEAPDVGVDQPR